MLRRYLLLALTLVSFTTTVALASPQEDATILVDGIPKGQYAQLIRGAYADNYAMLLQQKYAVTVRDKEKFTALFPKELGQIAESRIRKKLITNLIDRLEPDELAKLADFKRRDLSRALGNTDSQLRTENDSVPLEELGKRIEDTISDPDFESSFKVAALEAGFFVAIVPEIRAIEIDPHAPFFADILENHAQLFRFPNPVLKRDIIRDVREGSD